MSVRTTVKSIQDIMRQDAGVDGDAQRISQLCWMFFLKIVDDQDRELEAARPEIPLAAPAALAVAQLCGRSGRAGDGPLCRLNVGHISGILSNMEGQRNLTWSSSPLRESAELAAGAEQLDVMQVACDARV